MKSTSRGDDLAANDAVLEHKEVNAVQNKRQQTQKKCIDEQQHKRKLILLSNAVVDPTLRVQQKQRKGCPNSS